MCLSDAGKKAHQIWKLIDNQFSFVEALNFVAMPDHVHGIIKITNEEPDCPIILPLAGGYVGDKNPMFYKSLSRVIRWYKGRSTYEIRKTLPTFRWKESFYDVIIWNEVHLKTVEGYIRNNPRNWNQPKR